MNSVFIFIFLFIIGCVFGDGPLYAQTAEVSGRVFLPALKKSGRVFRGEVYRSRTEEKTGAQTGMAASSSFSDVVISFHPRSFVPDLTAPTVPFTIVQRGATFEPHVLPIIRGSYVRFVNDDEFYHNVFSVTPGNKFNIGRRPTGDTTLRKIEPLPQRITGVGEVKIFCDIHTQMNAIIVSLETPYFTTAGKDGQFTIRGLPPGEYDVRVYHPQMPMTTERIELAPGASTQMNFTMMP